MIKEKLFLFFLLITIMMMVSCPQPVGDTVIVGEPVFAQEDPATVTGVIPANATTLEIPSRVKTIGPSAFKGRSSLVSITIPDSITTIGANAFEDCSSLTSITIPNGLKEIAMSTFEGCSSLVSMDINTAKPTIINARAFKDCSSLENIEEILNSDLTTIGERAFEGCSSLETTVIPENLKSTGENKTAMGSNAFNNTTASLFVSSQVKENKTVPEDWAEDWNGNNTNIVYAK